jgi:hypothetical protein
MDVRSNDSTRTRPLAKYDVLATITPTQWAAYHHQIREVIEASPRHLLEVGSGPGILRTCLRTYTKIDVTSVDLRKRFRPDVVANVLQLPFEKRYFDVVCAFDVLGHVPFSEFESAVMELLWLARQKVILSLPRHGSSFLLDLKLPMLPRMHLAAKLPYPRSHDGQHQWQIGKPGSSLSQVRTAMRRHAEIERDYLPFDNRHHHVFVLARGGRKKKEE